MRLLESLRAVTSSCFLSPDDVAFRSVTTAAVKPTLVSPPPVEVELVMTRLVPVASRSSFAVWSDLSPSL